ncbi:predicted protein [Uncinocarpus reesii 1704]|uniref:DNA repair protein Swi5/Sae3 n=1 Tax=Uncinocarpus reesii (strain UAMH 1704) TaxID=336963 RepID=C4JNR8_UNCRE|nr:uncharacterized protein UREG_04388 [Uncinocarpus reesii 1704]EEP79542.1 predicted protein [Uncinocarpus reesii 1704]
MASEQKADLKSADVCLPSISGSAPELDEANSAATASTPSGTSTAVPELTPQQEKKIGCVPNGIRSSTYPKTSSPPDPATIVKRHIRLLHEYNEIKDIGQGLLGLIAERRAVRYVDVQKEFGVGGND